MKIQIKKVLSGKPHGKQYISVIDNKGVELGHIQPTNVVNFSSMGLYFVCLKKTGDYEIALKDNLFDAILFLGITSEELDRYLDNETLPKGCYDEFWGV